MKKIEYKKPIIEVIEIDKEDIITTSGAIKITDDLFGEGKDGVYLGGNENDYPFNE